VARPYLHAERRKPSVTLELLHLEYFEQHPDGYCYTQFCEIYRRWLKRRRLSNQGPTLARAQADRYRTLYPDGKSWELTKL
jgi:hypothetical protein